jgi:multiple sugar transport system ATP-binding protein
MTVYENMSFGLKLRRFPKSEIEARVNEAAEILGITHLMERRPKDLSGGQRQRVAVGRSIVRKPKVFLFDEPLSNLDAKMRVRMRLQLAKLHAKLQTTIIYVTHDQLEAMTLASHVGLMKDGALLQVAPPLDMYNNPANKFVGEFIGSPPMNFIEAQVSEEKNKLRLNVGTGELRVRLDPVNGMASFLKKYIGRKVVMGIRPEDIYDKVYYMGDGRGRTLPSRVDVVEPMGAEKYLYLSTAGNSVVARAGSDNKAQVNQKIDIVFKMENAKFFDAETQNVIT